MKTKPKTPTWVSIKEGTFAGARGEMRQQTKDRVWIEIEEVVYQFPKSYL